MNTYFKVIEDLKTIAIAEPFVNTVTQGDITEIDLNKTTIFPLCHISVSGADLQTNLNTLNISVILMDIIDHSKESSSSDIRGNNNEMDVLNTHLGVAARIQAAIARQSAYRDQYELTSSFSCEPFTERFENNMAGWAVTFTVQIQNPMTSAT